MKVFILAFSLLISSFAGFANAEEAAQQPSVSADAPQQEVSSGKEEKKQEESAKKDKKTSKKAKNSSKNEEKEPKKEENVPKFEILPPEKVLTDEGKLNHPFFELPISTEHVNSKYPSIQLGEYLEYDIYLGVTRVGAAWIFCDGVVHIGTHTAYHLLSGVKSASFVEKIYKVHDRNDSWFDTETLYSYGYYKELNEGHYFFNEWTVFDTDNKKYFGKKLNRRKELSSFDGPLEIPVSDILSSMYKVRALRMKKGEKIMMDVNTKKNWQMEASVIRTEKIATIFGKKKCIVGEPKVGSEGIFVSKAGKRLFVWLTDDAEQIPVLMKAETFFGSISAKLVKREMRYQK
ncbi:MAG: DUF3108 domain-containing protein [Elusimicrobiales bacterium]|nr:DUF3108 domain-containing protein [Elusimicrobiales bacterium]